MADTSILDTVRDSLEREGKTSMLYRIVLCGEVLQGSDVGAYYQKFFKSYQQENELITGIFILHPSAWIHILEASASEVMSPQSQKLVSKVKVLMVAQDVPSRYFPFWACRSVDFQQGSSTGQNIAEENSMDTDEQTEAIGQQIVCLINFGKILSNLSKNELKTAMDTLAEAYYSYIPKIELLLAFSNSDDVISLEEWFTEFQGHLSWTSESGI